MNRKSLITAVAVLVLILAGGTSAYLLLHKEKNLEQFQQSSISKEHILAEQFLPPTTSAIAAFNLQDANIKNNAMRIIRSFPEGDKILETILKEAEQNTKQELQITDNLLSLLGDNPRFSFSFTRQDNLPVFYLSTTIQDKKLLDQYLAPFLADKKMIQEDYKGTTIYRHATEQVYGAVKKDILFITNYKPAITTIIDIQGNEASLFTSDTYKQVVANLDTPYLGYFYVNFPDVIDAIILAAPQEKQAEMKIALQNESTKMIKGIAGSIASTPTGLSMKGYVMGDEAIMQKLEHTFSTVPNTELKLIRSIPASNTMMYGETFDLARSFIESFGSGFNKGLSEGLDSEIKNIAPLLAKTTGLDLRKDIFDLFDKSSVAFALQYETDNLMPQLTFMFDVTNHEESAKKIVSFLETSATNLLIQMKQAGVPETLIKKETLPLNANNLTRISLDFAQTLPNVASISPTAKKFLAKTTVSITFGITPQNELVITTIHDLPTSYGKSNIANENNMKESLAQLPVKDQGVWYMDISHMLNYADQMMSYVDAIEPLSTSDKSSYDRIVNFMKPLKYIIFSSSANAYDSTSYGIMKIGE